MADETVTPTPQVQFLKFTSAEPGSRSRIYHGALITECPCCGRVGVRLVFRAIRGWYEFEWVHESERDDPRFMPIPKDVCRVKQSTKPRWYEPDANEEIRRRRIRKALGVSEAG